MKKTCVEKDSKVTSETRKNKNQHNLCSTLTRHGLLLIARERLYNTNRKTSITKHRHTHHAWLWTSSREKGFCVSVQDLWADTSGNQIDVTPSCPQIAMKLALFRATRSFKAHRKEKKNTRFNEISSNNNIVYWRKQNNILSVTLASNGFTTSEHIQSLAPLCQTGRWRWLNL